MLRLAACHDHLEPLGDSPADLRARLAALGERVPRINRFIELALLGALGLRARCGTLAPDAAVHVASEAPMLADCVRVQQALVGQQRPPMPFDFMNLSGNMAGFHVGQHLRLHGPQLAVHRRGAALEAILELLALQSSQARRALVGYVEEGVWPLAEQRQRLQLAPEAPLAECSHWLYFDQDCARPLGMLEACHRWSGVAEARAALAPLAAGLSHLVCGSGIAPAERAAWHANLALAPFEGLLHADHHSGGHPAQALCRFASQRPGSGLLHINRCTDGSVQAFRYRCA